MENEEKKTIIQAEEIASATAASAPQQTDASAENQDFTPEQESPKNATADTTRDTRRPHWADALVAIAIFFVSQFIGGLISTLLGITPPDPSLLASSDIDTLAEASSLQAKFIACTTLFAMVLCFGFMALYIRTRRVGKILSFRTPGWASPFRLLCGYFMLWIFTIAIEPLADKLPGSQEVLGSGGWLLISAIFLAPIFEEIIFRGYIGGTLRKAYGATSAWLVSSILVGLVHGIPSVILPATLSGLVLGFYYLRYRSLILVIILHAMNNITACFLLSLGLEDVSMRQMIGDDRIYWVVYALCVSIAIIVLARMHQIVRELTKEKYLP